MIFINTIQQYGFNDFFEKQMQTFLAKNDALQANGSEVKFYPARIVATHKERYIIRTESEEKGAILKSSIFYNGAPDTSYPTTGDFVLVKDNPLGDDIIYKVFDRKSKLSRLDSFNEIEQVVAVNFDTLFIISSLNNDFNLSRLERYIASAWQSGGSPVIILTKSDLCSDVDEYLNRTSQIAIGIPVIAASVITGEGIEEISAYFKKGSTVVFMGMSGVGKSSLLNVIAGRDIMKVNTTRAEDESKGRHTTTHRQLVLLENGAMVIDTPGMREFGMWGADEGIDSGFNDIGELINSCRFTNCTHHKEPGCAVRKALKNGELTEKRLRNYYQLKKEAAFSERKEKRKLHLGEKAEKAKRAYKEQISNKVLKSKLRRVADEKE